MESLPYTGRLLNAIVLLVVALSAYSLSREVLYHKTQDKKIRYFGYFWLSTAMLWFASTTRNIFAAFGALSIDLSFFYVTNVFLYVSGIFLAPYLVLKIFKSRKAGNIIRLVYGIAAAIGIVLVLNGGIERMTADSFGTEYILEIQARIFLLALIAPLLIISVMDTLARLYAWLVRKKPLYEVLGSLSIAIYLSAGFIDAGGFMGGWQLIFFRIIFLGAFLIAYVAVVQEKSAQPTTEFNV